MILKALEIRGFKSFPDKTVLTFGKGITAVVGPNGSGKSNISDAIRWVLGEQSNKNLRGAKMEDVIFNGTSTRKALGFAEVSLTIDNASRKLAFDADEVRVTRRYYRSGDSEYLLNNVTVRLKDVQLLFMDTGLGRDGYSIIGQGRIADIVASRSEDRREIFEEAAGIAKYRYRKNEAERRLKAAEDNLLRLRDILQELEERVGPLEQQAKKAKQFLVYAEEKKGLEIGLWLHTIDKSRDILRDLSAKLELAKTQYEQAETAIEDVEHEIEELSQASALLSVQMDELRRSAARFEEEALRRESEIAVRQNDILHGNENIARIRGEMSQSEEGERRLETEEEEKRGAIEEKQQEIAVIEAEERELAGQFEALSRRTDETDGSMETLNRRASELALRLADVRVRGSAGETALGEITRRLAQLTASTAALTVQQRTAENERADGEAAVAACRETVESLKNTVSGYQMRYDARASKVDGARETADKLGLDAEEKHRRIRILEELERSMEGFSGAVKAVVKQGERGLLRGIRGPVSRLLETPAPYALAVETALGAAAQNIVCERQEDAKRGIAYLKSENAGRATFLPLDSIRGSLLSEQGATAEAGIVGIASELVSYDKEYEAVMRNLLGRTLLAEDLNAAAAVAKKYGYRFRVVTLDGQVVNAGGSLTGGSHVRGAGLLSRRSEIERLNGEAAALHERAERAREEFQRIRQEAAAAQAALTGAQGELSVAQEDQIRLTAELRRLTELAETLSRTLEEHTAEMQELHTRAEEQKAEIAAAQQETTEIAAAQTEVERQLAELTGGRQTLSSEREALSARMADGKLRILACRKEIEAIEQAIEALHRRKEEGSGYRDALRRQIEELEAGNAAIEQTIGCLRQETEEQRTQAAQVADRVTSLLQKQQEGEARVTQLRRQSREQFEERERLGGEVARIEEKAASASREADELLGKLFEEYELTRTEAEEQAAPIENEQAAGRRLSELRGKIRALGNVNVEAIDEYAEVRERYDFLSVQVKDVETSRDELLSLIGELTTQMREIFIERFKQINYHFGLIFAELFGGGRAELRLLDPEDVLHTGIEMSVQPPGKVILNLDALSGGEKAMTAIALLFAILKVTPSPFCVLDEIEAALDDVNVDRYAQYLRRMTDETQFIVITHRRGSMEEADVLYGVTMQEQGVTKLLELRASEVEEKLGLKLSENAGA